MLHQQRTVLHQGGLCSMPPAAHFYNRKYNAVSGRTWEGEATSVLTCQTQCLACLSTRASHKSLLQKAFEAKSKSMVLSNASGNHERCFSVWLFWASIFVIRSSKTSGDSSADLTTHETGCSGNLEKGLGALLQQRLVTKTDTPKLNKRETGL